MRNQKRMKKLVNIILGLSLMGVIGCATLPGRTVPDFSFKGKTIYLAQEDSIPKDLLALLIQHSKTNNIKGLGPLELAEILKVIPDFNEFSKDTKAIRENTVIRRVEILVKDYDIDDIFITALIKDFKEITQEPIPVIFKHD